MVGPASLTSITSTRRAWLFLSRAWPWLLLGVMMVPSVWMALVFPDDLDVEFPSVVRPTFNPHPPPAYRLAEPGDTIDRIAIYVSSLAIVLALNGLVRTREHRRIWLTAVALSLAAFWYAANPFPTFDGWHGLAWRTVLDSEVPPIQRLLLVLGAASLGALIVAGIGLKPGKWAELWRSGRERGVGGLLVIAVIFMIARQIDPPGVEPVGYWPRWAFVWALVAFATALIRLQPKAEGVVRHWRWKVVGLTLAGVGVWFVMVVAGIELTWFHRPIDRLRTVVPGRIYMSAMPTARGLEIAQRRHHFKTIINLFPEDTPYRSPRHPEELRFVREHGLNYYGSPADVASANDFLDLTLTLAQDPNAWPILIHCHACMDRTPAWVGIYRFVVEGRPLDEIFRFIEAHRGYRPKATVTLLYNRVLPRLAPERCMNDPTSALLHRCAEGAVDPYLDQVRAEMSAANQAASARVYERPEATVGQGGPGLVPVQR